MKRFYRTAAIAEDGPPYALLLDGKPVLTPQRQPLALPNRALGRGGGRGMAGPGGGA